MISYLPKTVTSTRLMSIIACVERRIHSRLLTTTFFPWSFPRIHRLANHSRGPVCLHREQTTAKLEGCFGDRGRPDKGMDRVFICSDKTFNAANLS